jgi:hypothetical protein
LTREWRLIDSRHSQTSASISITRNSRSDQTVKAAMLVTLDGSGCFAPTGHWPLTYLWQQIGGTPIMLSSDTISCPTFIAPSTSTVLTFTLVVADSFSLASNPDQVQINVAPTYRINLPLIWKM